MLIDRDRIIPHFRNPSKRLRPLNRAPDYNRDYICRSTVDEYTNPKLKRKDFFLCICLKTKGLSGAVKIIGPPRAIGGGDNENHEGTIRRMKLFKRGSEEVSS
jgi:hypothetical protein